MNGIDFSWRTHISFWLIFKNKNDIKGWFKSVLWEQTTLLIFILLLLSNKLIKSYYFLCVCCYLDVYELDKFIFWKITIIRIKFHFYILDLETFSSIIIIYNLITCDDGFKVFTLTFLPHIYYGIILKWGFICYFK
jgi:hypothetical protein